MPVPHCFDYCSFLTDSEIRKYESFNLVLFKNCFGFSESLEIPYEFLDEFFYICTKYHWDSDRDFVESEDHFG